MSWGAVAPGCLHLTLKSSGPLGSPGGTTHQHTRPAGEDRKQCPAPFTSAELGKSRRCPSEWAFGEAHAATVVLGLYHALTLGEPGNLTSVHCRLFLHYLKRDSRFLPSSAQEWALCLVEAPPQGGQASGRQAGQGSDSQLAKDFSPESPPGGPLGRWEGLARWQAPGDSDFSQLPEGLQKWCAWLLQQKRSWSCHPVS